MRKKRSCPARAARWIGSLALLLCCIVAAPDRIRAELVSCTECANEVSSHAETCQHCGCPVSLVMRRIDEGEQPKELAPDFRYVVNAMVIVETDRAEGSGFIIASNGRSYLITNQHVMIGAKRVEFQTLFDHPLTPLSLEVDENEDLARLEVDITGLPPRESFRLRVREMPPAIGDRVFVYGNSMGANVVTKLKGRVLAIGPRVVEVDAPFVPGNSGSPILDEKARVLGVATYVSLFRDSRREWLIEGTRFEEPRRFGIRLRPGKQWIEVDTGRYFEQTHFLSDIGTYLEDVADLLPLWIHSLSWDEYRAHAAYRMETYNYKRESKRYHDPRWCNRIAGFCLRYRRGTSSRLRSAFSLKSGRDYVKLTQFLREQIRGLVTTARAALHKKREWSSGFLRSYSENCDRLAERLIEFIDALKVS
jgi:hypothetical protein